MLDEMQVVAVADLPWPHNPSKCAHIDRFNAVRGFYDKSFDGHIPAGAHFFLSLDADCLAVCAYHQHDWLAIAAASVDLLTGLPPGSDRDDVLSAAADLLPAGPDRLELGFLFSDPITWSPSTTSITNGQHRTCALKASGATLCAALTYGERDYVAAPGDTRRPRAEHPGGLLGWKARTRLGWATVTRGIALGHPVTLGGHVPIRSVPSRRHRGS
jgi:hypothetical protein